MHGASLQSWHCVGKLTRLNLHVGNVSCTNLLLCYNWQFMWAPVLPLLTVPISLAPHLKAHFDAQMSLLALHAGSSPVWLFRLMGCHAMNSSKVMACR